VEKARPFAQLPFCIFISPLLTRQEHLQITLSLLKQNYKNYNKILVPVDEENGYSYDELLVSVEEACSQNSILLFVNQPLENQALEKMNEAYQMYNMWLTYNISGSNEGGSTLSVLSVYTRLFSLVKINDFNDLNKEWRSNNLGEPVINGFFIASLFELCRFNSMPYHNGNLYKNGAAENAFISTSLNTTVE
jgi:hypothetical protein